MRKRIIRPIRLTAVALAVTVSPFQFADAATVRADEHIRARIFGVTDHFFGRFTYLLTHMATRRSATALGSNTAVIKPV
jgi:hypothetical protein